MAFTHPHPIQWLVVIGIIAVAIAIPFRRRDDWLGWIGLLTIAAVAIGLWGALIWSFIQSVIEWWRNRSRRN
jgi:hypothetical protein